MHGYDAPGNITYIRRGVAARVFLAHLSQHTGDEPGSGDNQLIAISHQLAWFIPIRLLTAEHWTLLQARPSLSSQRRELGEAYVLIKLTQMPQRNPDELENMLTAFTAGLLLITISELGDKTFFIAMLLAMRCSRRLVFAGVVAALAAMTVLSVLMGQVLALMPKVLIHAAEVALFIGFGLKLLYDASKMSDAAINEEIEEAKEAIDQSNFTDPCKNTKQSKATIDQCNFAALKPKARWQIVIQAFSLTFMAEWGDRTQFATVALAASNNAIGVTTGAILGHALCAAIAVIGGRLVAGRISERVVTMLGGVLFLIFGIVAWIEGA